MSNCKQMPTASLSKSKELLQNAYRKYKPGWKQSFIIGFVAIIVYYLGVVLYIIFTPIIYTPFFIFFLFITLIIIISSIWVRVAYLLFINGDAFSWQNAYKQAWEKILPYLWTSALKTILVSGGLICFIIPGIIYGVYTAFTPFIFIDEKRKGIDALIRSKKYVKGYWWPVFKRLAYINISALSPSFSYRYGLTDIRTVYKFELYTELKHLKSKELSAITKPSTTEKVEFITAELTGILILALLFLLIKNLFF